MWRSSSKPRIWYLAARVAGSGSPGSRRCTVVQPRAWACLQLRWESSGHTRVSAGRLAGRSGYATNEIAVFGRCNAGFGFGLGEHLPVRFADQRLLAVVAVGDAVEDIFHAEELDHALRVGDVRVGEEPGAELGAVDGLEETPERRVVRDDVVEGEGVVDLLVVFEGVDFVEAD